jgi:tripartite-type tricarboxylate transporter receptor subunit TctC
MSTFFTRYAAAAALAAGTALSSAHAAQPATDWPKQPIRFIVPFPPGGTVDPLARLLGARLSPVLGQSIVVENRPGASGSIGAAMAAKAPADGHTFLFVFDTHAVNPTLIKLPFDTAKDLDPVMLVGTAPNAIVTNPAKPYKAFTDLVKASKAKPGSVTVGSIGSGSLGHLTLMLIQERGGIQLTHVPYKGGGPMTTDVLGGHVEAGIGSVALLAPQVRGGKMRGLVVTSEKRSHAMPDVPTLAEQGFPGLEALAWWGIFAPANVPKPIMERFHASLVKVLKDPEVRKQLTDQLGMDLVVSDPAALQKFLLTEMDRWGKVVQKYGIKPD